MMRATLHNNNCYVILIVMKTITLTSDEQLRIFMHPLRQKILRILQINGPMTPKMIADALSITSSSAKHHLLRLMTLGTVEIDHTKLIHGITATYYRWSEVSVSIGSTEGGDREALAGDLLKEVEDGFFAKTRGKKPTDSHFEADLLTGVVHLAPEEADELYKAITGFLNEHEKKKDGTVPFIYSLVAYHG